jgi:hypothetical protein
VLRLLGFVLILGLGAAGLVAMDYNRSVQSTTDAEGAPELTFRAYLDAIPARVASVTGSAGTKDGLPGTLADMLPRAPEGWTLRPATAEDINAFLPKKKGDGEPDARDLVKSIGSTRVAKGAEGIVLTYEKGERLVMVQAVRYPDRIFTDDAALDERFDLQMQAAQQPGWPFMTVRGLDVTEDFLGDGMRARYFFADVGGQIRVRMLASKRLKDADILPFFETLHVKAMNAAVVDRQAGLGDLPVIVLASAMTDAGREAYEADRAERKAGAVARAEDLREAARGRLASLAPVPDGGAVETKAAKPESGLSTGCAKGDGGIKRCTVGAGD